jgi:hypothetical protein
MVNPMLPHEAVWIALRDADEALRAVIGPGGPSALHLWRKFFALQRRLSADPPASKDEIVQRLRAIHDECSGELARFRPAVRRALTVAEHLEWQDRGNGRRRRWGRRPRAAPHALTRRVHRRRLQDPSESRSAAGLARGLRDEQTRPTPSRPGRHHARRMGGETETVNEVR